MRTRPLVLAFLPCLLFCLPRGAAAQVPVKLFTANDGQTDKGTTQLVAAVKKQLADMPKYKLWQGGPAAFPKNGVFIDIQGIDITNSDNDVIGSAVLLACSAPGPHDPGAWKLLYRQLIQLSKSEDIDGDASDFLQSMDHRVPAAPAAGTKSPAPARKPSKPKAKHSPS